ncbi:hypothetical protein [Sinosporangium siamense]|uniref:Uncharacterized protein n=1 Tax=Sinosporangium siamense TaxID=1367973 RepID=A0A919RPI1_9ACTN|nr:hypothetical protein [Sinosporangium siamense]GII97358.1 hypothetical protein Ssi02_75890 [Sinosporangium siamense]
MRTPLVLRTAITSLLLAAVAVSPAAATTPDVSEAAHRGGAVPGDPLTGSGAVDRSVLTSADLLNGTASAPVADEAFAVPEQAAMPAHTFEGRLTLSGEATGGGLKEVRDDDNDLGDGDNPARHLPEISLEFTQTGSHLVPKVQGLVITGHPTWNLITGPGRVWRENGDNGWSRASFPFALVFRNHNCTQNGAMSFLFNRSSVSQVRYQVTQETCLSIKFDMWGQLPATYQPYRVHGAQGLRAAHAAEVGARLPTKPFEQLAVDYPGIDLARFGAGTGVTREHLTVYGLLYKGVNYVSGCQTRHGTYAFCGDMRLPSYSTAKTAFASVAHMRLAQKYGLQVGDQRIGNLIPEARRAAADWKNITLENALDMATGKYGSPDYMADEDTSMGAFLGSESLRDKMRAALQYDTKEAPGKRWIYHTSDTFLATRAMGAYLDKQGSRHRDAFSLLRDEVFAPLKLSAGTMTTLRTDNSPQGAPYGGYGLFWNTDDIAKVAKLLNNDNGKIGRNQVLHPKVLADTMQRNPADRGLPTANVPLLYNNSTWASAFPPAASGGCTYHVPFMSGFGGITVAMMPNGASYYYFSDNNEFAWGSAVRAAEKLGANC